MNLQVVVIAHGNGIAAFRRHEKYWTQYGAPVLVICPTNDPVKSNFETIEHGDAEHNGRHAKTRLIRMFDELARREWTHVLIHEYDSICLSQKLPTGRGLFGNVWSDPMSGFIATRYANPPWFVDRLSLEKMVECAREFTEMWEKGEADRYISALAFLAGVPILPYDPQGFSTGTITEKSIPDLRSSIYKGGYAIHGIKQQWVLSAVEQFWDERPSKL